MCYIFRESMSETTFMTNSGHSGIPGNRGHGLLKEKGDSEIKTPGKNQSLVNIDICPSFRNQIADLKAEIEQETTMRSGKVLTAHLGTEWEDQDL